MILNKKQLYEILKSDGRNYSPVLGWKKYYRRKGTQPISDQWNIWLYIKRMRYAEYHDTNSNSSKGIKRIFHYICYYWYCFLLRRISAVTGFQIALHTCGKGLTIWHWGDIIINPAARIGDNCTLYPGVLIGHKNPGGGAAKIGNNCFIASGVKIIGNIIIGDNVTIAPNTVVFKDVPSNSIIAGNPAVIIKQNGQKVHIPLL